VNPHGCREENTFELVLKYSQIPNLFSLYSKHQKSTFAANMPARRHFFRSPSPELPSLRQATIGTSVHTRLHIRDIRPGPDPTMPRQGPHFERAAGRRIMGGPNDIAVTEMFRSYQHQFSLNNLNILGDDDNEIYRRCSYTREDKLAAIDMAINTWQRRPSGSLEPVSRYYVSKKLRINQTLLGRWIKSKHRITSQKKGAQRMRLSKTPRHPDLERKLGQEFEAARSSGRQITHRWFLR
jgi:hypothetical protein